MKIKIQIKKGNVQLYFPYFFLFSFRSINNQAHFHFPIKESHACSQYSTGFLPDEEKQICLLASFPPFAFFLYSLKAES